MVRPFTEGLMRGKQIKMHHVREVLRLKATGASNREVSGCLGIARSTVADVLARATSAGVGWPLAPDLTDEALAALIYKRATASTNLGVRRRQEPDWAALHLELKRPHMTLMLLWEEYRAAHADGYCYSRFCELYRNFEDRLSPVMRQTHVAGDKMFVDFAGGTVPIVVDRHTGEIRQAQIFVACLGASSYTFVQATWTQTTADWVGAQASALDFFGGAPRLIVPDNPKAAITRACLYEPGVQRTYADFAAHFGMGVLSARARKPRDKAKVESGVQVVQRWILAKLRNSRFTSLAELNAAIAPLLTALNNRLMRKLNTTRTALFESVERTALRALPVEPYMYAEWKVRRVGLDYHVDVGGHYYSVPYRYLRAQVDVRIAARTVEIFFKGERIAAHRREATCGKHTTQPGHMPETHRAYADWTIDKITAAADKIGVSTGMMVRLIVEKKHHPEQGIRACLGVVRLARQYGVDRLEAACLRALQYDLRSYGSIRSILENKLDRHPLKDSEADTRPIGSHANVRGRTYYN
jgi:transposase